jgi:hypothetical protein
METRMPKFLAVYTGSAEASAAAGTPSPDTIARGMAAWTKWMSDHAKSVVETGGPLGKTLKVSKRGTQAISNNLAGYVIVEAASHEDAAKMFENHPHFSIFPGEGVEIMPVLPVPTR